MQQRIHLAEAMFDRGHHQIAHIFGGYPSGRGDIARRTKASIVYGATGNLRAVQILLGYRKIENMVRYLGIDVEDALAAENTEI
ncbi:Integrase [Sphingobium herbicidovorans NBRC 16415]|uniref:Integrase n=1 Tax=Sphingobium herbicidovorans (strain ATCC 700291 / DSM 11019 / CCUG 56400 / KCTC 2939 / LMG 18315 / NBRC 16415 / MH) TaxID=1219045 RepID=A0A086P6R4_SPHHM|nr:Integrase [Sphingobium herbicidovorans NBRC 16415]